MTSFIRTPGDFWLKFTIGDVFPKDDPLARDIVRMMTADEDLQNLEAFKFTLETHEWDSKADAVSRTKWNRAQLLLLRLRFGFLSNVLDEVVFKVYRQNDRPSLESIIRTMPAKAQNAYDRLREAVKEGGRANEIIGKFRNLAAFHYSDAEFRKALETLTAKTGEIIANEKDHILHELHFIIGYQIIDVIPAGQITKDEVVKIRDAADLIQGLFHSLTIVLFDQYVQMRSLKEKITREEEAFTGLVDRLGAYRVSTELQNAKITLTSGITVENPVELIRRFYTEDGHILYDLLPVAEDDRLDPACLIAPAFFLSHNTRFHEWRDLWQRRSVLEEPLQKIPCELILSDDIIPWAAIKEIFANFLEQKGFRISKTSKILHKKRPHLIPILDERIISHYYKPIVDRWLNQVEFGSTALGARCRFSPDDALKSEDFAVSLVEAIRQDLLLNLDVLKEIQAELNPFLQLSLVRLFDLILWQNAGQT